MAPTPPVALPPVIAQYSSTLQQAGSASPAAPSPYKFSRASDGKTRVDSGNMSVISNPAAAQTIVLDHVNKTATIQPTPPAAPPSPTMPQMPGFSPPAAPAQPQMPPVQAQDLGKTVLQGHEVQGKLFVIPSLSPPKPPSMPGMQIPGMPAAPATPQAPGMPGAPKLPQVPGMQIPGMQIPGMPAAPATPQAPGMPGAPKPPQAPGMQIPGVQIPGMPAAPKLPQVPGMQVPGMQVPGMPGAPKLPQTPGMPTAPATPQPPATAEVWSSTSMGVPMLTKVTGSFGQLTQVCHTAIPGEPSPSAFQIPPGYKLIIPKPPAPPKI